MLIAVSLRHYVYSNYHHEYKREYLGRGCRRIQVGYSVDQSLSTLLLIDRTSQTRALATCSREGSWNASCIQWYNDIPGGPSVRSYDICVCLFTAGLTFNPKSLLLQILHRLPVCTRRIQMSSLRALSHIQFWDAGSIDGNWEKVEHRDASYCEIRTWEGSAAAFENYTFERAMNEVKIVVYFFYGAVFL